MDKQTEEILQKIEEAEYVLVGLGQEFDMEFFLQSREDYRRIREQLQQQNVLWLCLMWKNNSADSICRRWKQRSRRDCRSWQKYWKKELFCGFIFAES